MKYIGAGFSWIFTIFFILLFIISFWAGYFFISLLPLVCAVLLVQPIRLKIQKITKIKNLLWARIILIPLLFVLTMYLIFNTMGNPDSIYKTQQIEKSLMDIYDVRMEKWPGEFQTNSIKSSYGDVHVISCGPDSAEPLILLHASAMAGWSWLYNIEGLNKQYRCYAIDMIGDAGKSRLKDIYVYPNSGQEQADYLAEILDSLKVEKASLIGASAGGFIASNMAVYKPERVKSLVLCGPMGYAGTDLSILNIVLTTMFPIKPMKDHAFNWAFGDALNVREAVNDWFVLILEGVISRQARPVQFSDEQLNNMQMPVLFLLGSKDGLVGNPENMRPIAAKIPNADIKILPTGHLISVEKPDIFNKFILDFYNQNN